MNVGRLSAKAGKTLVSGGVRGIDQAAMRGALALADASLVVSSDLNKGGTWAGATEQLDKLHLVPVYVRSVRSTGATGSGLDALRQKGALPWPDPQDADALDAVFDVSTAMVSTPAPSSPEPVVKQDEVDAIVTAPASPAPADMLFAAVRDVVLQLLKTPMKDAAVAAALQVSLPQAKTWLQRLVEEGLIEKQKKPAGYIVKQSRLFE